MSFPRARSLWMLLLTALAAGCASPGAPIPTDDPDDDPLKPPPALIGARLPPLKQAPADFHFLIDRSASWSKRADRWHGLTRAVSAFMKEHEGTPQYAATVFPQGGREDGSCEASDYTTPDRAFATSSDGIRRLLDKITFGGGSTLGPALEGTIRDASTHAAENPTRTTSVIVLTDATPNDDETCDRSAWETVATIAGQGFGNGLGPVVHVHVISVVSGGISPDHFARMDDIVDAGNGYAAVVNGSTSDVRDAGGLALDDIYARMTTCTMIVPPNVHPEELTIRSPDGTVTKAKRVSDATACEGSKAAFYLDDPENPHLATLCSGPSGRAGLCEATYVRAESAGAPAITISATTPKRAVGLHD